MKRILSIITCALTPFIVSVAQKPAEHNHDHAGHVHVNELKDIPPLWTDLTAYQPADGATLHVETEHVSPICAGFIITPSDTIATWFAKVYPEDAIINMTADSLADRLTLDARFMSKIRPEGCTMNSVYHQGVDVFEVENLLPEHAYHLLVVYADVNNRRYDPVVNIRFVTGALWLKDFSFKFDLRGDKVIMTIPSDKSIRWDYTIVSAEEYTMKYGDDKERLAADTFAKNGDTVAAADEYAIPIDALAKGEYVLVAYASGTYQIISPATEFRFMK